MEKLRIACCGGWHSHAKDFPMERAKIHCSHIPYEYVAVWDDNIERGTQWAQEMGCAFEPDYDKICSNPDVDAVMITAGTTKHADMIVKAANAGKHIFVEKALATKPEEAYRAREAVKKSGIHFTISDPVEKPALVYAKKLMDEGTFGEITNIRYRTCHPYALTDEKLMERFYQKDEAGAGAMFDMGHHAVHVLLWFMGKPTQTAGIFSRYTEKGKKNDIDDVSTAIFQFENGSIGVAETGWVCPGGQNIFELYGTKGFLRWDCDGLRYRLSSGDWIKISNDELPPAPIHPLRYWMESIVNDTPNTSYTIDEAVAVSEMIAAAYQTDNKLEKVNFK